MTLTLYVCVALPVFKHVNMTAPLRSGERGNVLSVGTYCCVAVQARSARRREALRSPQMEQRGGGILWRLPAYSLLKLTCSLRFMLRLATVVGKLLTTVSIGADFGFEVPGHVPCSILGPRASFIPGGLGR